MRNFSFSPEKYGYTGRMHEGDFLPHIKKDASYYKIFGELATREAIAEAKRKHEEFVKGPIVITPDNEFSIYLNMPDSMELVRKTQEDNPINPKKEFARDLRLEVAELLEFESDDDLKRVRVYGAVETPLDIKHGTDGFIEYVDVRGKTHIYRFDLTANPMKSEDKFNKKGSLIIGEIPDPQHETKLYLEKVAEVAKEVAEQFKSEEKAKEKQAA